MGAVHGVHLKYAAMSAMSLAGAWRVSGDDEPSLAERVAVTLLLYSAAVHALITSLFLLRRGEWILGKDADRGTVPLWCVRAHHRVPIRRRRRRRTLTLGCSRSAGPS